MKTILLILALTFGINAQVFDGGIYFLTLPGIPQVRYDNTKIVEWIKTQPPEWQADLVSQGYATQKKGYYEIPLRSAEYLDVTYVEQITGIFNFSIVPDSVDLSYGYSLYVSDADTNLVDYSSVDIDTYYIPINNTFPAKRPTKIKKNRKANGRITYPNKRQFLSRLDKDKKLKKEKRKKVKKKKIKQNNNIKKKIR